MVVDTVTAHIHRIILPAGQIRTLLWKTLSLGMLAAKL